MPETEKIRVYFLASGEIAIPLLDALMQSKRLELVGLASQFKEFKGTGPLPISLTSGSFCWRTRITASRIDIADGLLPTSLCKLP